jgi:hypothetical protein
MATVAAKVTEADAVAKLALAAWAAQRQLELFIVVATPNKEPS